ncbi:hypothetical protein [Yersinia enterocolitica]|uniref:Uncharacterized protein n=1 Tax=Yersinia enterocolitica TaxID=630 RepID=A0ABM9S920_YEREN|nr:hypothetical protein [Yersinia enterocolitica]CNE50473.1 Uncharacterised protein [Yersinia enterocolitica]
MGLNAELISQKKGSDAKVPDSVVFLTEGFDTNEAYRIEIEIVGWEMWEMDEESGSVAPQGTKCFRRSVRKRK